VKPLILEPLHIEQKLLNAALPIFLVFTFIRFYFESPLIFAGASAFLVFYGNGLLLYTITKKNSFNSLPTLVVALLLICALLTAIWNKNETLLSIPQFFGNLGFAWGALYAKLRPRLFIGLFLCLSVFLFIQIINGVDSGSVFNVSRNFISVILILSIAFYYFSCTQTSTTPRLFVPFFGLILMLWGIGRAGIASGAIILLGALILSSKRGFVGFVSMATFAVLLATSTQSLDNLEGFFVGLERLERMGADGQRSYINSEYLNRISNDNAELLFGASLSKVSSVVEVDGNPHNSYIKLHTVFGLTGTALVLIIVLMCMVRLYTLKKGLLLLMLIVTMFRSTFDVTAFHGPLDVVIFFCVFYTIQSKRVVFTHVAKKRSAV
jgi:hypothetical protein